mgnify:CR=1 FL=1
MLDKQLPSKQVRLRGCLAGLGGLECIFGLAVDDDLTRLGEIDQEAVILGRLSHDRDNPAIELETFQRLAG